jgi:hypothetical protein
MWESRCLFTRGSGARIVDIDYGLKSNSANFVTNGTIGTNGLNPSHDPLNVDVVEESIPSSSMGALHAGTQPNIRRALNAACVRRLRLGFA